MFFDDTVRDDWLPYVVVTCFFKSQISSSELGEI